MVNNILMVLPSLNLTKFKSAITFSLSEMIVQ